MAQTTVATDIIAALQADAALTALVGQGIRFDMADERDVLPYVIVRQTENLPVRGLDSSVHTRQEVFQIESWGTTRAQSAAVHSAVEDALDAADFIVDAADPDGIDPTLEAYASVWTVVTFTG